MPILLSLLFLLVVMAVVRQSTVKGRDDRIMPLMIVAFVVRLVVHMFSRDLALFSHGGGGDYSAYEFRAQEIIRYWDFNGMEFVSEEDMRDLGPTSLPPNLFALIFAVNGGEATSLACTALIATFACLTCVNIYQLAVELGADPRKSFNLIAVLLFSPAFLLYTSDMYKDGAVIFFGVCAVASSIRLARSFSWIHLAIGAMSILALWYIRYYLVFVTTAPLIIGVTGLRAKSSVRPILATILLVAVLLGTLATTDAVDAVSERASVTFVQGTSRRVISANSAAGSGVAFDDGGSPWGALGPKLAYMVFSPFPWSGGSVGFHIGKLDALLWYFIVYRAAIAARRLWQENRALLLMLLMFPVPTTIVYATSFANVGLSLRQRLIIVMVVAVLAMLSWPAKGRASAQVAPLPRRVPPRIAGGEQAAAARS